MATNYTLNNNHSNTMMFMVMNIVKETIYNCVININQTIIVFDKRGMKMDKEIKVISKDKKPANLYIHLSICLYLSNICSYISVHL